MECVRTSKDGEKFTRLFELDDLVEAEDNSQFEDEAEWYSSDIAVSES